jgi:hypothetical protein
MLTPGTKYDLTEDWNPVELENHGKMLVGEPQFNFNVTFVEFSDGSSFGKSRLSGDLHTSEKRRCSR